MAASPIPVVNPDGSVLTATPKTVVEASYTRPTNTTAYTGGDSISNSTSAPVPLTFSDAARASGRGGVIVGAVLHDDSAPGTAGDFTLLIFESTVTATNDNAALSVSDTDGVKFLGSVTFTADHGVTAGTLYDGDRSTLPLPFKTTDTANLFGLVRADNAYTPASGGVLTFRLLIEQD